MQALGHDVGMLVRYRAPRPVTIELSLARVHVPPAWRPALLTSLRLAMGTCVGAMFGAAAGHGDFWIVIGAGLGVALEAISRRIPRPPVDNGASTK